MEGARPNWVVVDEISDFGEERSEVSTDEILNGRARATWIMLERDDDLLSESALRTRGMSHHEALESQVGELLAAGHAAARAISTMSERTRKAIERVSKTMDVPVEIVQGSWSPEADQPPTGRDKADPVRH